MKFIILLGLLHLSADPELLLIDKSFKRPPAGISKFEPHMLSRNQLPVFAADKVLLINALLSAAKKIDKGLDCNITDTIWVNHSNLFLISNCEDQTISVHMSTQLADARIHATLVHNEADKRRTQRYLVQMLEYLRDE